MFNPQNNDQSAFIKLMGMQSLGNTGGNLLSALLYLLTQMKKKPGQPPGAPPPPPWGDAAGGPGDWSPPGNGWFDPSTNSPSAPLGTTTPDMWS